MKVIKVGGGSQSRIAQACDRCRSKKIRCDGVRPCCTQCANVGFECKTSDKLSRRAFPRGYTESLEERVRALESETRELKSLLDEKDEKIDVLSRIYSFSPPSHQQQQQTQQKQKASRSPQAPSPSDSVTQKASDAAEGVIHVKPSSQSTASSDDAPSDSGLSSTRGFTDAFTGKLNDQGKLAPEASTQSLTQSPPAVCHIRGPQTIETPPRLVSDQLINIYFQEWAPLYPVVHRPTVLKAYEQYLTNAESMQNTPHDLAQLNLIFGIAALASISRTNQDPAFFEKNWTSTLESLSTDISVPTLQCFLLAQIHCMTKADYTSLLRYRGIAVGLCHQLRLHQSQKHITNPLIGETRKKIFWCQYVLDRLTAAMTGLPILLREEDIRTEYPEDVDDENITETGFLPTLPGESTRLSSAIALFAASRILNTVLHDLYSSESEYDVYVSKLRAASNQLDEWAQNLPPHLRLEFAQDKPATNVTSSRSPLLSLVYYYIRSLVHRPAVCFADEQIRSPSVLAVSDSSKHIIQILELLDERRLCLSVSINRKEIVLMSGLGLLWQTLGLKRDSKLAKESQKLLSTVIDQLKLESASAATEFSNVAGILVSLDGGKGGVKAQDTAAAAQRSSKSPKKQVQSWKQRLAASMPNQGQRQESQSRRATICGASPSIDHRHIRSSSQTSLPSVRPEHIHSPHYQGTYQVAPSSAMYDSSSRAMSCSGPSDVSNSAITVADWEFVLSDMDRGYSNIFTGIYGGKECGEDTGPFASITAEYGGQKPGQTSMPMTAPQDIQGLSPEAWSATSSDIPLKQEIASQSVLSYSEDSMAGGSDDGVAFQDLHMSPEDHANMMDPFRGIVIPTEEEMGSYGLVDGTNWDRRLAV